MAGIALPWPRSAAPSRPVRSSRSAPVRQLPRRRRSFSLGELVQRTRAGTTRPLAVPRSDGAVLWIAASLLFVTVALNFYVFQVSVVATSAYELQRLEREREGWQARNEQLLLEVSKTRSLRWIEHEAVRRLGMVRGEEPIYVRVDRSPLVDE